MLKQLLITLFLLLLTHAPAWSLDTINTRLLQHAKDYPHRRIVLEDLVAYLVEPTQNEFEKAEVFFYWIASNIDYDVYTYQNMDTYLENTKDILRVKKGVCGNYAQLFLEMCTLANIECYKIIGYAKGLDFDANQSVFNTDHAWNIVQVDGQYLFVDCTWGSGNLIQVGKQLKYERDIKGSEVLVSSDNFKATHLPEDPMWQLTNPPISLHNFVSHTNYEDMIEKQLPYNFQDSINIYKVATDSQKRLMTTRNAYLFNPTPEHLSLYANAYSFVAYYSIPKEFDEKKLLKSIELYNKTRDLYLQLNRNSKDIRIIDKTIASLRSRIQYKL